MKIINAVYLVKDIKLVTRYLTKDKDVLVLNNKTGECVIFFETLNYTKEEKLELIFKIESKLKKRKYFKVITIKGLKNELIKISKI